MQAYGGVSPGDGLAMWVADMDFRAADVLQDAVRDLGSAPITDVFHRRRLDRDGEMNAAVAWWMKERHGWDADPAMATCAVPPAHMAVLGHAIALILETYTDPGDEVIIFTPVYHEFTHKIELADRVVHESPLVIRDGVYHMDLDALEAGLTGRERMMLISSPHNPAGRIWTPAELRALSELCARHDLLMVADEIHHDLVFPGQTFTSFLNAAPEAADRCFMLTAASKTFNTAGARVGTVTIPNPELRKRFRRALLVHQTQPNLLGVELTRAAYSPGGAAWVDDLVAYLDGNHRLFLDGMAQIPGLKAMPMQSTYLAWVGFEGTGMEMTEVLRRVHEEARLVPSVGAEFGTGGEAFLRFNIGTPRARVAEAVERLQAAFADLQ